MQNNLYWIREEDYYQHIRDKVLLYSMLRHLTRLIRKLPANRGSKDLKDLANTYTLAAEKKFVSWNLPASYLISDQEEDLEELMEKDLITPERCSPNCPGCHPSSFKMPLTPEVRAILRDIFREIYENDITLQNTGRSL